jgi:hypothetical protein
MLLFRKFPENAVSDFRFILNGVRIWPCYVGKEMNDGHSEPQLGKGGTPRPVRANRKSEQEISNGYHAHVLTTVSHILSLLTLTLKMEAVYSYMLVSS